MPAAALPYFPYAGPVDIALRAGRAALVIDADRLPRPVMSAAVQQWRLHQDGGEPQILLRIAGWGIIGVPLTRPQVSLLASVTHLDFGGVRATASGIPEIAWEGEATEVGFFALQRVLDTKGPTP